MTGPKPSGHLPRGLPGFNKKELELLLLEQMAQLEAMRELLVDLKLVTDSEFEFLVKKASARVMQRLAREGFKTVQVFPGSTAAGDLLRDDDDAKR